MGSKRPDFGDGASPGKIFIGGLSKETSLDEFVKYFSKYGDITDSVIMKDRNTGRPRGFGFITYADPAVVDTVITETHIINDKQVVKCYSLSVWQPSMAESSDIPEQPKKEVCSLFKKPSKGKNIRKRPSAEDGENEDVDANESSLIYNKKKAVPADNKLFFSTGSSKQSVDSNSDVTSKAAVFQFESSKEIQVQNDSRATATLETETEFSKDARAIRERVLKQSEEALQGKTKASGEEKLYKGIHGYTDYKAGFRRELTVASEKAGGSHGPLRASAHIRVSARFDYQPDICKDYKETGYCGYGDSCKFMHDRGDYKSGWQIEKEWDEAEKARKRNLAMGGGDDEDEGASVRDAEDDDDSLPFACFICREPFVDPVITRCKHYFCQHCALKHHAKNKKCFVCNQNTNGVFNTAFDIIKRMKAEGK